MTKEEYFGDWTKIINVKEAEDILNRAYSKDYSICPCKKDVFKAFRLCPPSKLRVLVLGQDPYPDFRNGKPVATGIAFANDKNTSENSLSPSLMVLKESIIDFTIPHGDIIFDQSLEKWEEQGVLMLNSALTCISYKPGSHTLLWMPFIKTLLANLSKNETGIVYVLMGKTAQAFENYINKQFNHIIKVDHPSWFARARKPFPKDLWRNINDILIGQNGYGIKWYEESNT